MAVYFWRPGRWAGDVDFVADGAAETAAGDGVGWRHEDGRKPRNNNTL